ncbi:MAG: type IX secretion system membrane protein PorP/SprF [Bacteroidota bacterium]|nr:type IX secretion system membrane protein PorP/SprF [Bacteroidota bacterium]
MKLNIRLVFFMLLIATYCSAQQLPYYSQYKSNMFMINPGITGTKRLIDARMNYRMQWIGYDGAPRTSSFSLHSRFLKGKMGAGIYMMQDKTGPSKQTNLGASYAYHLRFPDCELSAGVAGNFTKYTLTGGQITIHNSQDPAINQFVTNSTWTSDLNAGIYLYNDRFHLGVSALRALQSTAEFYKNDSLKKGLVKYATHVHLTLGYNYSQNEDYVWESTLQAYYVPAAPLFLDYTLRMHYREKVFGGISIRLKDAVALHLGMTIMEDFQVSYSYDLLIGKMRKYSSGSHEIMLVCSTNIFKKKKGRSNDEFLRQRYGYLF